MERLERWFRRHQAKLWLVTLLAIVILGALAAAPRAQPAQWEYRALHVEFRNTPGTEARMNKLGAQGWRYAGMAVTSDVRVWVVLERQK